MIGIIETYGIFLLKAMLKTLELALWGLLFACILGLIFGILSVLKNKICKFIAQIFVDVIRGVPMIVLAYFIYFGIPYFINQMLLPFLIDVISKSEIQFLINNMDILYTKFTLTALQAGTIALALNCGAYMAEIIRAGIQSVDVGQMEAARSLGLTYWKAMRRVVLPQAIKTMIPSIINQFIITLKDTSILSVIGFPELVNAANNVVADTFKLFQVWAIVAIMYLVVITILSKIAKCVERRMNRGRE